MNDPIPYIAYESALMRADKANKRLWIIILVLIASLILTNVGWIVYESQFIDEVSVEQEVDTGEGDAIVHGIGDFNYGEGKTKGN